MDISAIHRLLADTAYVRTGGSTEERRCADYLCRACRERGLTARTEDFEVPLYTVTEAQLTVDGTHYPCKGYFNAGDGTVTAPLYYLTGTDPLSLSRCRDRIVLIDGSMGYWLYRDLLANGAVGFITYDGNVRFPDRDIDQKELRYLTAEDTPIPGVSIHVTDAIRLAQVGDAVAAITLHQKRTVGRSCNVIADLPGETDETVILSAHYDSTPLSVGAYDNLSGCIGLLYLAEHFARTPHRYGIRLVWCGSEERGLLGSLAYCQQHRDELDKVLLNINLDMLGCIMGPFVAFATADEKTRHYLECVAAEEGFGLEARLRIRSSDSNVFADNGVPAVSFARYAPGSTATIHDRYDRADSLSAQRLLEDMAFITAFTERLVTASHFPLDRAVADTIKEELDRYFRRKR